MKAVLRKCFGYQTVRVERNVGRLDAFLKEQSPAANWGKIQAFIKTGKISVMSSNQRRIKKNNYQVRVGDEIRIDDTIFEKYFYSAKFALKKKTFFYIEDIEYVDGILKHITVFRHDDFIVINKPCGMYSQGTSTLKINISSILNSYFKHFHIDKQSFIVHRLDKTVSGIMFIATNRNAARVFSQQIKHREMDKIYEGIGIGLPEELLKQHVVELALSLRIGFNLSKQKAFIAQDNEREFPRALCDVRVLNVFAYNSDTGERRTFALGSNDSTNDCLSFYNKERHSGYAFYTHFEFKLISGKKHQLRIISQKILNCPLINDAKYGYPRLLAGHPESVIHDMLCDEDVVLARDKSSNAFLKGQYSQDNYIYLQSMSLSFLWKTNDADAKGQSYDRFNFRSQHSPHMKLFFDFFRK